MSEVDTLIEQGKAAIKAGRKGEAKAALSKAVELDEASEQGWLWLSACVDSVEEQQICLENVLAINPDNEKAKKGLAAITQTASKPSAPAAPPAPAKPAAPAAPPADPFDGFDSNIFAGTGFDSNPYDSSGDSDPALGSGWGSFDASLSDDSISSVATSVDWGRDNEPSAYGSGKKVDLPSADEYDSWVSNLSLGGGSTAEDTGFSPADGPFSSAAFDFDAGADSFSSPEELPARTPNAPVSPFDDFDFNNLESSNAFSGPFDTSASPGPFSSDPTSFDMDSNPDPFGSGFGKGSSPVESSAHDDDDMFSETSEVDLDSDPFADMAPSASQSSLGRNSPAQKKGSDPFGNSRANVFGGSLPTTEDSGPGGFAFIDSNAPPSKEAYFSAIPPEIQADGSVEKPDNRLIMTVAVLAALNVLSLAFLLMNLTK